MPFAIWVRVSGFFYQGRALPALAAVPLAFFLLGGLLPVVALFASRTSMRQMGNVNRLAGPVMDGGMVVEEMMPAAQPTLVLDGRSAGK